MKTKLLSFLTFVIAIASHAQVTLVKEINDSGTSSSNPANLTVFNGKLYFAADDSNGSNTPGAMDLGKELWVTDGTESGTEFILDINTGSANSNPFEFFIYNSTLYFNATQSGATKLFSTDGTALGTVDVGIGTSPGTKAEYNGLVYFVNTSGGSGNNNKLNTFDGSTITKVPDVGPGLETILTALVSFDNKLFCYMNYSTDDATVGNELYAYDPSVDTFTLIKDIDPGTGDSSISNFTIIGNELYFEADNALWKTDGTEVGTVAVTAASSITFLNNFYAWNGKLYFEGDNGTSDDQLWVFDPALDTLTNISNISGNNHDPSDYVEYDGYLYYSGQDASDNDNHLFRTDGSTIEQLDSTIKDVDDLAVLNGVIYFEGDNGTTGNELYSLDPTTLSTGENQVEIVKVFPNPINNQLNVSKNLLNAKYSIHDINGKTLKTGIIMSTKIDLDFSSGMYLFKAKTDLSTITKKIIVK